MISRAKIIIIIYILYCLYNPFLVNIDNGFPILHPILTNKVNLKIKLIELLEDESLNNS